MMSEKNGTKILFSFYSDILDSETTEELFCAPVNESDGYYQLLQFPFYLPKLAKDDIIWAGNPGSEGLLTYRSTVEYSGNSTIHVAILDEEYNIEAICNFFDNLGCETAKLNLKYFAIHVPAAMNYFGIKRRLDELEREKIIDYAESCLSKGHSYRNISL